MSNSTSECSNMSTMSLEGKIIKLGQRSKYRNLEVILADVSQEDIMELILKGMDNVETDSLFKYILSGLSMSTSNIKLFEIILCTVKAMSKRDIPTKRNMALVTDILIYLNKLTSDQKIELCEFCLDSFRNGDPNSDGWKDLLPEIISNLSRQSSLLVNGVPMTGDEYRGNIVKTMCSMKCPGESLSTLAGMFKEIYITNEERIMILGKLCKYVNKLTPMQLPPLAFQMFAICNSAQHLLTPIIAFQKYFHKNYYRKLYADMHSDTTDFDSIDVNSDTEFLEAGDTILYHLANRTESSITETEIVTVFKNLSATPHFILTPFIVSAIIIMSNMNRYPDTASLASSQILPFLRTVIKNNEDEKKMIKKSAWCRDTCDTKPIDFNQVLSVLIEQNKDGGDVVTPGMIGLAFILLKAKHNSSVNTMGVTFLQKFLKKRFIFGQGVVKHLAEFLFADQDACQYAHCLKSLSVTNTLTIAECVDIVRDVLEYFLLIPGQNAMKMMAFVYPLIKISHPIRDALVDMLRKAMYHRELETRQMAVYGFCMLLKQLRNNNSRRGNLTSGRNHSFSQMNNISGFSLMSQNTIAATQNPMRHFDTMTLEIVGILTKCFSQPRLIKDVLYEGLNRAIESNGLIIPHILQYLDMHFRSYFIINDVQFEIKFDLIVHEKMDGSIEEMDNLGELVILMTKGLYLCDKHNLIFDSIVLKQLMESLVKGIARVTLENLGIIGGLTHKTSAIAVQFLNTIEALMTYCVWMTKPDNQLLKSLSKLFTLYSETEEVLKNKLPAKKGVKRGKKSSNDTEQTTQISQNTTSTSLQTNVVNFKPVTILNLGTLYRFLQLIHDDNASFVDANQSHTIRINRDLSRYILKSTIIRIEELQNEPDYRQVQHSRRIFDLVINISNLLFQKCLCRLEDLCMNFDPLTGQCAVECFKKVLLVTDALYKRKFDEVFMKTVDGTENNEKKNCYTIIEVVEKLIDKSINDASSNNEELDSDNILPLLLDCLEVLYQYIPGSDDNADKSYKWLYNICESQPIKSKNLQLFIKLLFVERVKTHTGLFFNTIAMQIQNIGGSIDETTCELEFELKAINEDTLESTVLHLCNIVKKQLEDAEYFATKAKSFHAKLKIIGQNDNNEYLQSMKSIEKSICSQLMHIAKTLVYLSNTQIPLGPCSNAIIRLITQFYITITSLTRHFIARHSTIPLSFQGLKFDQLVRTGGKHLATKVYSMILHIDENLLPEQNETSKKNSAHLDKLKVVAGTKFTPRLILCLESFNKFVIILSKKTKYDLSSYLHIGTVRDFRIKTNLLKETIDANHDDNESAASGSNPIENIEEDDDVYPESDPEQEILPVETVVAESDENSDAYGKTTKKSKKKFLENLKEINKTSKDSSTEDPADAPIISQPHKTLTKTPNKKGKKRKPGNEKKSSDEEYRRSSKRVKK